MQTMIQQSVSEALNKRKEDREKRKSQNNKSGDLSSDSGVKDSTKLKYFEQRFNEVDEKFKENEKVKEALQRKVQEYERMLQEKGL